MEAYDDDAKEAVLKAGEWLGECRVAEGLRRPGRMQALTLGEQRQVSSVWRKSFSAVSTPPSLLSFQCTDFFAVVVIVYSHPASAFVAVVSVLKTAVVSVVNAAAVVVGVVGEETALSHCCDAAMFSAATTSM